MPGIEAAPSPRLILAPVGMQTMAVLAPLLSPPVRPQGADQVVLLHSPASIAVAGQVKSWLQKLLGPPCRPPDLFPCAADGGDIAENFAALIREEDRREVWLLLNGGLFELSDAIMSLLESNGREYLVASSRDHRGFVSGADGTLRQHFRVGDVGLDHVLEILELKSDSKNQTLWRTADREKLRDVAKLVESSGLLIAAIATDRWFKSRKVSPRSMYRNTVLDSERLHRFGLEARRTVLIPPVDRRLIHDFDTKIAERARKDLVPLWQSSKRGQVRLDDILAWPEQAWPGEAFRKPVTRTEKNWTRNPLVVVMGTQPATTLRAIWVHKPSHIYLVCDPDQPKCAELARALRAAPELGAEVTKVNLFAKDEELPQDLKAGKIEENTSPGDKQASFRMRRWAQKFGWERWYLARSGQFKARTAAGTSTISGDPVPLRVWLDLHAVPGRFLPGKDARAWASEIVDLLVRLGKSVATTSDLDSLADLRRRHNPPCIRKKDKLSLGPKEAVSLNVAPFDSISGFFVPGGFWWEPAVAAALVNHGFDEVQINGEALWPDNNAVAESELDVIARIDGRYSYWSCKTKSRDLEGMALEARAQGERYLGRDEPVFLVVPRLRDQISPKFECSASGHQTHGRNLHVVDAQFLQKRDDVRKLAGR